MMTGFEGNRDLCVQLKEIFDQAVIILDEGFDLFTQLSDAELVLLFKIFVTFDESLQFLDIFLAILAMTFIHESTEIRSQAVY